MAKLVYFTREISSQSEGGRLNFIKFETERIDRCIEFIKQLKEDHERLNGSAPGELSVVATGGGAYKYYDKLKETLKVDILREDEMDCLITGTNTILPLASLPTRTNKRLYLRAQFFHYRDTQRSFQLQ